MANCKRKHYFVYFLNTIYYLSSFSYYVNRQYGQNTQNVFRKNLPEASYGQFPFPDQLFE